MGVLHFQPARGRTAPEIRQESIEATATFPLGAPLQRDATEDLVEEHAGTTTVTGIIGIAMAGVVSGAPDPKGGTSYGTTIPVAIAEQGREFLGQMTNTGAVVTPDSDNEGVEYGILKVGGEWYVDEEDVTNVVLTVTKVFPEINAVLFKFLASAIAD